MSTGLSTSPTRGHYTGHAPIRLDVGAWKRRPSSPTSRGSLDRQGRRGCGLEAQPQAVGDDLAGRAELTSSFTDVERTPKTDRSQLAAAFEARRHHRAALVIANLDRIARHLSFISGLMERGVACVSVEMPKANRLTLHILSAMVAPKRIRQPTNVAWPAAKAQGVKLSRPEPTTGAAIPSQGLRDPADRFAAAILPVSHNLQTQGITSDAAVERALHARDLPTANQRPGHPTPVKTLLTRLSSIGA